MEKIIELCKKLNALAKQGVGGEKHNAAQMLKKLMEKHDISIDEIEQNKVESFMFNPRNKRLFMQIAASVLGSDFKAYRYKRKKGVWMDLFLNEYLEIEAKYAFYQRAYNKELKKLVAAFTMRNNLYPKDGSKEERKLSPKELAELMQIYEMSKGLDRHHFNKQITN